MMNNVNNSNSTTGTEYKNKGHETPFETFLKYTNEKEKSSTELANILQKLPIQESKILDIGTGNGEFLHLTLSKVKDKKNYNLTLLEPSKDLSKKLHVKFHNFSEAKQLQVIPSSLADYMPNDKFDIILASHLFYHIPRPQWPTEISRMISLLRPNGYLIIVLRDPDDIYTFKTMLKSSLFKSFTRALLLDDIIDILPTNVSIKRYGTASELRIPYLKSKDDTISIIEFLLNKSWNEIPETLQQEIFHFIEEHHGVFKQLDGIVVIQQASPRSL